jgi:CNH domain
MPFCKLKSPCSHASGVAPQDGYAMCDVRRLRNFPRPCRQGERGKDPFYFTYPRILFVKFDFFFQSLFAYHVETLVPSSPNGVNTSPQKLNGSKDVHFFSVGSLGGRTLVIYMKKKGVLSRSHVAVLDSDFRVLEPVVGNQRENKSSRISQLPTWLAATSLRVVPSLPSTYTYSDLRERTPLLTPLDRTSSSRQNRMTSSS